LVDETSGRTVVRYYRGVLREELLGALGREAKPKRQGLPA
jgi:hypothetical protein